MDTQVIEIPELPLPQALGNSKHSFTVTSVIMTQDGPPNKAENESHSSPTQCKGEISNRVLDQAGLTGGEHLIPGSNQA